MDAKTLEEIKAAQLAWEEATEANRIALTPENQDSTFDARMRASERYGALLRKHAPALIAAAEQVQWRPIETAPKDGTDVLLRIEWSDVPLVAHFLNGKWIANTENYKVSCGTYCQGGNVCMDDGIKATHWMPLPPSPGDEALAEYRRQRP